MIPSCSKSETTWGKVLLPFKKASFFACGCAYMRLCDDVRVRDGRVRLVVSSFCTRARKLQYADAGVRKTYRAVKFHAITT